MVGLDKDLFNKAVGSILSKNRKRVGLSAHQVSKKVKHISPFELKQIENGNQSLPCYVLYELLSLYTPTEEEVLFFCCPQKLKEQFSLKH